MNKLKSKFDNMAIKWKIFGYLLLFCATLLFLLWISQVVFLSSIYEKTRIKQMVNSAKQIETYMKGNVSLDNVTAIAEKNEACVVILASNGTVLHSTDVQRDCMLHKSSYMDLLEIVMSTQTSLTTFSHRFKTQDLTLQLNIRHIAIYFMDIIETASIYIFIRKIIQQIIQGIHIQFLVQHLRSLRTNPLQILYVTRS